MRIEDLHHKEFPELDPEGGVIRFAGQRALLLDAVAIPHISCFPTAAPQSPAVATLHCTIQSSTCN